MYFWLEITLIILASLILLSLWGLAIWAIVSRSAARERAMLEFKTLQQEIHQEIQAQQDELENLSDQSDALREKFAELISIDKAQMDMLLSSLRTEFSGSRRESSEYASQLRKEMLVTVQQLGEGVQKQVRTLGSIQENQLKLFSAGLEQFRGSMNNELKSQREQLHTALDKARTDSEAKLESIRKTVDENLNETLERRLGESFKQVGDRLKELHQGIGEMQALVGTVGDLKKVLTNVKTRGIWGEVQLGNILQEMFTQDQYACNVAVKRGSAERVEYAILLPGSEPRSKIYLPIDAKFPKEDYERILDASEAGDSEAVERAAKALEVRIRTEAAKIRNKYIAPPKTTNFAVMFLPTEGLYAEALRRPGLVESLQRDYRVVVTGPTTLLALLNSLQVGFHTLLVQKKTSEIWKLLENVRRKFMGFAASFEKAQKKITEAGNALSTVQDDTRILGDKLKNLESLEPDKIGNSSMNAKNSGGGSLGKRASDPDTIPIFGLLEDSSDEELAENELTDEETNETNREENEEE